MTSDSLELIELAIAWKESGQKSWTAVVDGRPAKLRQNNFPDEPLYTVEFDGQSVDIDDVPKRWVIPCWSQEVEPKDAWPIIIGFVVFFIGALISMDSRIVGGVLMAVPLALLVRSQLRTPKEVKRRLWKEVARQEQERESWPKTGRLWMIFHRTITLVGIVCAIFFVVMFAYSILDAIE